MGVELGFINGASVGIEYMPDDGSDEMIKAVLVVDIVIFRLAFVFFRT